MFCNRSLLVILFCLLALPLFSQEPIKITHGPYLQHVTEDGATIVWTTNCEATSWVELAPDDTTHFYLTQRAKHFGTEYGFKRVGRVHTVRLENLTPGTSYRYRIYSQEVLSHTGTKVLYGNVAATNVYSQKPLKFTTTNPSKEKSSFLMLTDIHGQNDRMEQLLKAGDYQSSDFIIFNGDMVSDLQSEEQLFGGFMDLAVQLFAKEKPIYFARGNHETRGNFAVQFPQYFPTPDRQLYYIFRQGPIGFIVLDCGEDKPDSDIEYSGIVAFDSYRDRQAEWLKNALKDPKFQSAPVKIVVVHMPPFGGWHGEQEIAEKFVPLLNGAGIDLMLCGHLHQFIHQPALPGKFDFPILVNSNNTVVRGEVNGQELTIKVLGEDGKLMDSFSLKKK